MVVDGMARECTPDSGSEQHSFSVLEFFVIENINGTDISIIIYYFTHFIDGNNRFDHLQKATILRSLSFPFNIYGWRCFKWPSLFKYMILAMFGLVWSALIFIHYWSIVTGSNTAKHVCLLLRHSVNFFGSFSTERFLLKHSTDLSWREPLYSSLRFVCVHHDLDSCKFISNFKC